MDLVTRRKFLLASGVVGAGALSAGGIGLAELFATAKHPDGDGTEVGPDRLVVVTLYGGNDGLNTVIPYADPVYQSVRRDLAYPPERVLHLDRSLGLNPAMTGLKRLWDGKRLAVVLGVGYPKPDRSHFRSMDIWQTASPAVPVRTGWVGRWLDGTSAPPEAAVSFEPVLPPLLAGETRAGACVSLDPPPLPDGINTGMLASLGQVQHGEPELQARAATAVRDFLRVDHLIRHPELTAAAPGPGATGDATGTGGETALAAQLALTAACIEAGVATRVYSVSLGGFDTHADERSAQERLLKELDAALTGFVDRMSRTRAGRGVTVVVYSEFGRRVRANASQGTDHGTAGPVFVLGQRVAGGFYGEQPSLSDLDSNGDLKTSTDFRDVFGTLLAGVLVADPDRYITGYRPRPLPLLHNGQ